MATKKSLFDRFVAGGDAEPELRGSRTGAPGRDRSHRRLDSRRRGGAPRTRDDEGGFGAQDPTTPEAMRRLLTSGDANPTLRTVLDVLAAWVCVSPDALEKFRCRASSAEREARAKER